MKYHGKIIIKTVLFALMSIGSAFAQAETVSFMSYNINADQVSWDAGRGAAVITTIDALDADVVGLQEASSQHKSDIADALADKYELIDFNDSHSDNNFEPVLVRRDRFTAELSGAVEITQACEEEGVGGRFVNWVQLYDNTTDQRFMFYNNHFCTPDYSTLGLSANQMHAVILSQTMTVLKEFAADQGAEVLPAVVAGSFNADRASSSARFLLDNASLYSIKHDLDIADTWEVAHPGVGKPATTMKIPKTPVEGRAVDYVLVEPKARVTVVDAQVIAPEYMASEKTDASDHFPVIAGVSFQ